MKKLIFCSSLFLMSIGLSAQDISILFQAKVSGTAIDSVLVLNQRTGQKVKLVGNESLTLTKVTSVNDIPFTSAEELLYPNPCNGRTEVNFATTMNQEVKVSVYNISGQLLSTECQFLISGQHRFYVTFQKAGIYNVLILKDDGALSFKTICLQTNHFNGDIQYIETKNYNSVKNATLGKTLVYAQGDILNCSACSGKNNTIIADSPTASKIYSIEFYECKDPENNNYPIVKIGTQWWMAENLKTTKYNDWAAIINVTDNSIWKGLTSGAYCWYNNDAGNKATYGALYNWYAVNTGKLCPTGWHMPTDAEWTTLSTNLGGESGAGGKMKETGTAHWLSPNTGVTNESGFSGLPGGGRDYGGAFGSIGYFGYWWSSTEYSTTLAWARKLNYDGTYLDRGSVEEGDGFSVRCVRD